MGTKKNKKKRNHGKFNEFRRRIFRNPKKIKDSLYYLKYNTSIEVRKHFFDAIFEGSVPGYRYIFHGVISKSLKDVNKKRNIVPINQQGTVSKEMDWAFLFIVKYIDKINKYVDLKDKYEKQFVLGDATQAQKIIEKINEEITYSIWGVEQELILSEMHGGFAENKKFLSETAQKTNNYFLLLLIDLYSFKAELESSYNSFSHHVKNINEKHQDEILSQYLNFKFESFYDHNDFTDLKHLNKVLFVETLMSIIDIYETYIKICMVIVSSENSAGDFTKNHVVVHLKKLNTICTDYRIGKILCLGIGGEFINIKHKITSEVEGILLPALDEYTLGNYKKCLESITTNFNVVCTSFEAIELIAKCSVHLNCNVDVFLSSKYEFLNEKIIAPIYKILICNEKGQELKQLMNTIKTIGNCVFKDCLTWFCLRHLADYRDNLWFFKRQSFLNSKMNNPLGVFCFKTVEDQNNYLGYNIFSELCGKTHSLYISYLTNSFTNISETNIPRSRFDFYKSKSISNSDHREGITRLKRILSDILIDSTIKEKNDLNLSLFYYERVAACLYNLYVDNGYYIEALNLFVDSYLNNKSLTLRMKKANLKENLESIDNEKLSSNIKSVIFQYLCNSTDHLNIYISLANYLDYNMLDIPSQLIEHLKSNNTLVKEVRFILEKIYNRDIMKHFVRLHPRDRPHERIKVLQYLSLEAQEFEQKKYTVEINQIIKEENIKERIKQVDEKRIFVDTKSILSEFDEMFSEKFIRYKKLKKLDFDFYDLVKEKNIFEDITEKTTKEMKEDRSKKQRYLVFKEFYLEYLNQFLYNPKYGLDKFLSSRIRHGILENKLSKSFKDHNLLSLKLNEDSEDYNINEYWDNLILQHATIDVRYQIIELKILLSGFSKKIIDQIFKVYNWVRIRDENNANGMFDFDILYSDVYLTNIYSLVQKNLSYTSFCSELENIIWEHTENIVSKIRERILNELHRYFIDCLDELKEDLSKIKICEKVYREVIAKIKLCKTLLINDLNTITKWFYVRKSQEYHDYSFDELIRTCLEINSKINNFAHDINIKHEVINPLILKGDSFYYFLDIVNILYTNAIQHSGFKNISDHKIDVSVNHLDYEDALNYIELHQAEYFKDWQQNNLNFPGPVLVLKFTNKLSDRLNIYEITRKIQSAVDMFDKYDESKRYVSKEGGTGLIKINTILKFNIQTPYYLQTYFCQNRTFICEIFVNLFKLIAKKENKSESPIN